VGKRVIVLVLSLLSLMPFVLLNSFLGVVHVFFKDLLVVLCCSYNSSVLFHSITHSLSSYYSRSLSMADKQALNWTRDLSYKRRIWLGVGDSVVGS
jgi:hypothetical protein